MTAGAALTTLEASFLELEHPGIPMHVAGISILEGGEAVTLAGLHHLVASRIHRLPKFRQRVAADLTRRTWIPMTRVDLRSHLFHHRLHAPSTTARLFELAAEIHEAPLSREGPLWEMHLIDGLAGRRQALLIKTHHAITDGLAGVEMGDVLFDRAPGVARGRVVPPTRYGTGAAPSSLSALQALVGLAYTAVGGPIAIPGPFNGRVGSRRAFAGTVLPMRVIKAIKQELGVSVDDVLVATVAAGLRRYLHEVSYPGIPHALRAMIPVSTRTPSRRPTLGNQVTSIFLDLPLASADLDVVARRVAAEKAILHRMHAAAGATMLVEAAGRIPAPVHGFVLGLAAGLPFANLILSDIPGAPEPRYLLGRRITECYPMMPLTPLIGLSVAAISMGDGMAVGVTADPELVPEPERIARSIARVLAERSSMRVAGLGRASA
jgi:diacylglycerol O-acyltransferase / wax synthase